VPPEAIVAADVGSHHNWLVQLWTTRRPRRFAVLGIRLHGLRHFRNLGAKLAAPEAPCVAVVGDGSFLMTPHAVATAVEYGIPVCGSLNNFGFTSIRDLQLGAFAQARLVVRRADTGELTLRTSSLARSFGADGCASTAR
jgi:acetolactate synthase-1/2/3 large subunit